MDGWGSRMLAAVQSAAQLAAEGLGLPPTAFSERMAFGPHLLAPTGALPRAAGLGRAAHLCMPAFGGDTLDHHFIS